MEDKQNTSVKNASEEAFDVTGFFLECISYWKWFVASVVVLAVAVMFYCFRQTPVYEVTSAVYIQDNKGDNSNILLESLGLSSYKKNIDNEIEVLRSKNQITDVVEALNLYTSYSWNSFLRNVPLYEETPIEAVLDSIDVRSLKASLNIRIKPQNGVFHLEAKTRNVRGDEVEICNTTVETFPYSIPFHKGFIRLRYTGDTIPTVDKTLNISLSNPRSVSKSIAGNLTVAFASKDATILKVVYRTPVIKAGEDFIKTLVDFYNIDAAKQKNQGTEKTQQFIDARLDSISKDLSVVEARGSFLRYLFAVSCDFIERSLGVLVAHSLESDVPFCAVDATVVGKEGEFAVAFLLAPGQDVSAVGRCQTVTFAGIGSSENLDVLVLVAFLPGIARGAVVESQTDSVE